MNKDIVKKYACQNGADLIGIASIDQFRTLEPEQNPLSIAPECKSVVVLGRRILRGSIRGIEEGTNFDSTYTFFGYRSLEDNFLARTTYNVTCFLEEEGFEGVPLFGYDQQGMAKGVSVAKDKPVPNVILDVNYAAQVAGLGEIGLGGFFLTPQFGPRQRFSIILTDAELEVDPIKSKTLCVDCQACVQACPFGAIDIEKRNPVGMPEYKNEIATINYDYCKRCPNGAMTAPGRGTKPDRCAASCGRECIIELEKRNKLTNTFKNKFRKRSPWALDLFQKPIKM